MAQMLEEQRESWGTRGGFILAAVGSAVGLGNLWGFPYKLYSYGGGAFLIPYVIAMFCIGIPMLILEFSLGHFTQRAAPNAYRIANKKLEFVGWWGIILGFVIITYYPVILAYCFSFLGYSIQGIFGNGQLPWAGQGVEGVANAKNFFFSEYLGYQESFSLGSIQWRILLPLVITWAAMYFSIFKGVKLVGKIVWLTVPLPWLMLVLLTVRGLTLPGSMKGLAYYLNPTWEQLLEPTTWRFAFGQVFFSLSLAFGVMLTYASFLHRKSDINNNAAIIGISDFATSFVAGLAVFATLGAMTFASEAGGNPIAVDQVVDKGPGLAFVAFPYALAQLPYSAWFSFVFFFALVTLGIDSGFSITESVLAAIVDKTGWRRCIVLPVMSVVGLLIGVLYITKGGLNWLGTIDGFINGTWGIAFVGMLECVVLGWVYRIDKLRCHANERSDWKLGKWWNYAIRIFIPIVLGTLFLWSLFDDFTAEKGFIKSPDGQWIWPNCVGLLVVAAAPVISVIMSLIKGPFDRAVETESTRPERLGRRLGTISLLLAIIASALLVTAILCYTQSPKNAAIAVALALIIAINGLLLSNRVLDRFHTNSGSASWFARWGGILSTLNVSGVIAALLIYSTRDKSEPAETHLQIQHLSGVSYVILGVVFLMIIGGLAWCFYRAVMAAGRDEPMQVEEGAGMGD